MRSGSIFQSPNLFPSSNVVYLDKDFRFLRSKGLIAFGTLDECVGAWRSGGIAAIKYGTPSATNPGAILVGVGSFDVTLTPTANGAALDVNFLNIVGQGKDISIITDTIGGSGNKLILLSGTNISFNGVTLLGPSGGQCVLSLNLTTPDTNIRNVKISGSGIESAMTAGNGYNGKCFNCDFINSETTIGIALNIGGNVSGASFDTCTITSNSPNASVTMTATNCGSTFTNCLFNGNCLSGISFSAGFIGNVIDCIFITPAGKGIVTPRAAITQNFAPYVKGCTFQCSGAAIDVYQTSGAKFIDCYMLSSGITGAPRSAVLISGSGAIFESCRIIGAGTGFAIHGLVVQTNTIVRCSLRKQDNGGINSSVSDTITNLVNTPLNVELPSGTRS